MRPAAAPRGPLPPMTGARRLPSGPPSARLREPTLDMGEPMFVEGLELPVAAEPERPWGRSLRRPAAQPELAGTQLEITPGRIRNELFLAVAALACGLLVVPVLFWYAAHWVIGPYQHGQNMHAGPMVLLHDYFAGLAQGSSMFWVVALGPLVILTFARVAFALLRPRLA